MRVADLSTRHALDRELSKPWVRTRGAIASRYSEAALRAALTERRVTRLARDVYAPTLFADSLWVRARASVMCAGETGAVTGRAALFLAHAIEGAPDMVTLAIGRHHHLLRRTPRTRYYRTTVAPAVWHARGLPLAEPDWALVHAMREVAPAARRDLAITALASGVVSPARVAEILESLPSAKGRRELVGAISLYSRGIHSPLERRALRDVLGGTEFAHLQWQYRLRVDGRTYRIDAFDEEANLAIEFDGLTFHATPERWESDRERDTLLATVGIHTVRFTCRDGATRPEWCVRQLKAIRAQRRLGASVAA